MNFMKGGRLRLQSDPAQLRRVLVYGTRRRRQSMQRSAVRDREMRLRGCIVIGRM